jgi:hypothetical protein
MLSTLLSVPLPNQSSAGWNTHAAFSKAMLLWQQNDVEEA